MPALPVPVAAIGLPLLSPLLRAAARRGHLRLRAAPRGPAIPVARDIAVLEPVRQGPADRIGRAPFPAAPLKTIRALPTLAAAAALPWLSLREPPAWPPLAGPARIAAGAAPVGRG